MGDWLVHHFNVWGVDWTTIAALIALIMLVYAWTRLSD